MNFREYANYIQSIHPVQEVVDGPGTSWSPPARLCLASPTNPSMLLPCSFHAPSMLPPCFLLTSSSQERDRERERDRDRDRGRDRERERVIGQMPPACERCAEVFFAASGLAGAENGAPAEPLRRVKNFSKKFKKIAAKCKKVLSDGHKLCYNNTMGRERPGRIPLFGKMLIFVGQNLCKRRNLSHFD